MKPHSLVLAASLAANALLLTLVVLGRDSAKSLPFLSSKPHRTTVNLPAGSTGTLAEPSSTALNEAIASRDPVLLRDQLRALGLPDDVVRRLIRTMLLEPYYARYRALIAQHQGDKPELLRGENPSTGFTKEERAELRALSRSITAQVHSLFGATSADPTQDNLRYSYLPQDKADQLRQINRDYAEMRTDLNEEMGRFRVASDDQKLKLLEQERRKDIEALLSPTELADYDLRHSATASVLRTRLANLTVSESEFRTLFDTLKPVYDLAATSNTSLRSNEPLTPDQIAQLNTQRDARARADEQIHALLGEERYAEYNRAGNQDYRNLQTAATRFNLPPQTVEQVYSLRNSVSAATQQVATNAGLTPDQKKAALTDIANQTRAQVRATLGQEIGDAYLKNSMQWLERVDSGYTVTFSVNGNATNYKNVVQRNRSPSPTPPAPKQ